MLPRKAVSRGVAPASVRASACACGPVPSSATPLSLGAGWVLPLGTGFTLNPWFACHQLIAGDREASCSQATYHPKPFQFEASLKIGYTF